MQLCRIIYYSLAALHVSTDIFARHQDHLNCITASGITHVCHCQLVSWECWHSVIPEAVIQFRWSWWWAKISVEIIIHSCILLFIFVYYSYIMMFTSSHLSLNKCKLYKSLAPPHFGATHDQTKKNKMGSACISQCRDDIWVWMWGEDMRVHDRIAANMDLKGKIVRLRMEFTRLNMATSAKLS